MAEQPPEKKKKLTDRQNLFCRFKAKGKSNADAYRDAFNNKAGDPNIHQKASVLMAMPKIQERIKELQAAEGREYIWTRNMAIMYLIEIVENEVAAFALGAIKELNVMHGFDKPLPGVNEADEDPIGITVTVHDARKPTAQAATQPQEVH